MDIDPRKPLQKEEPDHEEIPEVPRDENESEIGRKHFPSPGRDSALPPLPDGQTA